MPYIAKMAITVALVLLASETAKRFPALGAAIIALPITSMLAMCFLYYDTKDTAKVADFAREIPAVVIPSIFFFYAFAALAKANVGFVPSMSLATLLMLAIYGMYLFIAPRIGL